MYNRILGLRTTYSVGHMARTLVRLRNDISGRLVMDTAEWHVSETGASRWARKGKASRDECRGRRAKGNAQNARREAPNIINTISCSKSVASAITASNIPVLSISLHEAGIFILQPFILGGGLCFHLMRFRFVHNTLN